MIKLKHIINDVVVKEYVMVKRSFTIGRSKSNSLQLDDGMASGEHAVLRFVPNEYMPEMFDVTIRDLGLFDEGSAVGTQTEFYVPED